MSDNIVTLHFEAEQVFENIKNNGGNIVDAINILRVAEMVNSAQDHIEDFEERMDFYARILKNVFGEEFFSNE